MSRMISMIAGAALLIASTSATAQRNPEAHWIESWGTAQTLTPQGPPPFASEPPKEGASARPAPPPPSSPSPFVPYPEELADQTVRMIVRTSAGGEQFRLEFSNALGGGPVTFGSVHAALAGEAGAINAGSDREVSFGGKSGLTLFPGARVVSDPIDLAVAPLTEVAVSIYLPNPTPTNTVHALGLSPAYIVPGNATAALTLSSPQVARSYFWLNGLSVPAKDTGAGTIVALGDSITDGYATTPGMHAAWPSLLAERLQADSELSGWGVVNVGISGNRILNPGAGDAALARFDEDVLARPGVKWVIVLEGINDINMSIMPGMPESQHVTAGQIIDGLSQLIDRAHLHGVKVAGGTVLGTYGLPFYNDAGRAMWEDVNQWIRTSGRFDAVIDFEAATRDSDNPLRINPEFDPGDHVHPNDAGNRAMAGAIDLNIFR
ncbi:MAG TPA: SGNH/GDSL hydrolase family protein [Croceibacterium sp.]|nr:SGNH/GDSL hydrolase family protein [Croceibacterium sp.]